ncbi:MAG: 30S ribosomal protein S20 [Acidobacteria bacterium]|nr:MAG: 30S ribosomal protein S20 [Acidobacteriota bacterium]
MANSRSADKRNRQNATRKARNQALRSRMRTAVKKLRAAIQAGDGEQAKSLLPTTLSVVAATAQKGVIHKNAAARTQSRLTRAVNALGE